MDRNPCEENLLSPELFELQDASSLFAAWRAFLDAENAGQLEPLNEAKLLVVGDEAVGKTSLVRYLIDGVPCKSGEEKTAGISQFERIETSSWRPGGSDVSLNVWDFGGQEIMHGTHRYFLTNRSVYLLVLEDRREDNPPVQPWMRVIESLAGESPVVIVINKSDDGKEALKLDEAGLKRTYSQIAGFVRTSCVGGTWSENSIAELREQIAAILNDDDRLRHVRSPMPNNWRAVKDEVARRARNEAVLTKERFLEVCLDPETIDDSPIKDPDHQTALLRQLHELGIVVAHGLEKDSPAAVSTVTLLDPNWLTTAIYRVLNEAKLRETGGEFTREDLANWLDPADYPVERHEFIVSMMRHDEVALCFRVPGESDRFLAPEALPKNSPNFDGWAHGATRLRYRYSHIPGALVPRLIVALHDSLTEPRTVWRTGAKLRLAETDVLLQADRDQGVIDLSAKGGEPTKALWAICVEIDRVNGIFEDLTAEVWIPMADDPGVEERLEHVRFLCKEEGPDYNHWPTSASHSYRIGDILESIDGPLSSAHEAGGDDPFPTPTPLEKQSSALTQTNVLSALSGIVSATFSYLELGSSIASTILLGFLIGFFVRVMLRIFERGALFRRLFTAWVTVGLGLVGYTGIALFFDTEFLTVSWGGSPSWVVAFIWAIGLLSLAALAFWEHRDSGRK